MPKKCMPGVICVENITLFFLVIIISLIIYIGYREITRNRQSTNTSTILLPSNNEHSTTLVPIASRQDTFNDPYTPPLKNTGFVDMKQRGGIPINVQTRGIVSDYQQVGILTRQNAGPDNMILPLMGKKVMSGRDKWQYYTISGSGNLNTKLPISVNGKSCTGEYGCDDIYNGDTVFVEGYNDTFNATIYENNLMQYIPQL